MSDSANATWALPDLKKKNPISATLRMKIRRRLQRVWPKTQDNRRSSWNPSVKMVWDEYFYKNKSRSIRNRGCDAVGVHEKIQETSRLADSDQEWTRLHSQQRSPLPSLSCLQMSLQYQVDLTPPLPSTHKSKVIDSSQTHHRRNG